MKKLIIALAGVIMIGLIIAMIVYQKSPQIVHPQLGQTTARQNHQQPQNNQKQSQSEPLQPIYQDDKMAYALQNNQLKITFDKGENWITVPVIIDQLFGGEYNGNKQELIEHSYILTKNRVAFLHPDDVIGDNQRVLLTYTLDQGKTWHDAVIAEQFPGLRYRKVAFLNDHFGYVVISGSRTMSQEYSTVYLTHDGGKSWSKTKEIGVTRLISDGGFIDESTGFLSYGTINPEEPDFYVTQDGGKSWRKAKINIPSKYNKIFVTAEIPIKEGNHLDVLLNQGPNGDYKGGKVKGKFISKDNGLTWEFSTEVKPDETEEG